MVAQLVAKLDAQLVAKLVYEAELRSWFAQLVYAAGLRSWFAQLINTAGCTTESKDVYTTDYNMYAQLVTQCTSYHAAAQFKSK